MKRFEIPGTQDMAQVVNLPDSIAVYGALTVLAAHCPVHKPFSAVLLNRLFLPAAQMKCVRLFQVSDGMPCAALIWARLSAEVSRRMTQDNKPPAPNEWNSGSELWFLDLMAPFGHGKEIARHLARNPPADAFSFARVGADGRLNKVVNVANNGSPSRAITAMFLQSASIS